MTDRAELIEAFLTKAGWGRAQRQLLAGDASARRYDRLTDPDTGASAVFMDAPPQKGEDIRPFLSVAARLAAIGLSAPVIHAADTLAGFVLLEDLGDDLFARVCSADPASETELYTAAIDTLIELQKPPAPTGLQPYSIEVFRRDADLLSRWYLPAVTGHAVSPETRARYTQLVVEACTRLAPAQPCFTLRDFHAENLLWLPGRKGVRRVGLLDFQDALAGHPAYDLVSLLEDARRDTSLELRENMIARYLGLSGHDPEDFRQAYATLGAQRNLRIIGVFTRLCVRDGKSGYLDLIPRVWDHVLNDLAHPALAALRSFVLETVPAPGPDALQSIRENCP